uniref:Uncharacterized protein n=1 Tax=Arundo donax TaxID=35708 RepID=A0A0A9F9C3_ARUDO
MLLWGSATVILLSKKRGKSYVLVLFCVFISLCFS